MTVDQMDLLSHRNDPETSFQAADKAKQAAMSDRQTVLAILVKRGPMTAYEINEALGWDYPRANRRISDLKRWGFVRNTGQTRTNAAGNAATVWEATR